MSVAAPDGRDRRALRAAAFAAALALWARPLFAASVEVPQIEAPVGTGSVEAAPAAVAPLLAPALSASVAPALQVSVAPSLSAAAAAAPVPAAVLAPAAAAPAALAPAAALAAVPAAAAPGVFGKRAPSSAGDAAPAAAASGAAADGESAWANSSALFDLSQERGAAAPVPAGLPGNDGGKIIARLRRAGESGRGPGAIAGMSRVEWLEPARHGYSGETVKLGIAGRTWFLKKLGPSPDPVIAATPAQTRARNEAGFAAVLREDPQLSRSFTVAPRVSVFRDGANVYVLSEGLPAVGNGESERRELSPVQRADAAIIQLVLGLGDMHGGNVLPLAGGGFGLVDFEKLSHAPLETASLHAIDEQVLLKNFPLVDRLSANDPALYRSRFEEWKRDYDSGGRARMNHALAEAGWSRPEREEYLSAVDRNAATYLERLQPYLDYANGWHARIQKAQAEAARRRPPPRKGFLDGLFSR